MSSQTNTTVVAPAGAAPNKRFELPALDFKFSSLTEGTDIPPPLPSPIQEEAAPTPPETTETAQQQKDEANAANGKAAAGLANISTAGTKRRAEDSPASPTLSTRPGSIRRLFSRGLLNTAYTNGDEASQDGRPQSRGAGSAAETKKAKRSSGWFGRLRGNDNVASKPVTPASPPPTDEKPTGPPPPMIPELAELSSTSNAQADNGFGSDLFRDIK